MFQRRPRRLNATKSFLIPPARGLLDIHQKGNLFLPFFPAGEKKTHFFLSLSLPSGPHFPRRSFTLICGFSTRCLCNFWCLFFPSSSRHELWQNESTRWLMCRQILEGSGKAGSHIRRCKNQPATSGTVFSWKIRCIFQPGMISFCVQRPPVRAVTLYLAIEITFQPHDLDFFAFRTETT